MNRSEKLTKLKSVTNRILPGLRPSTDWELFARFVLEILSEDVAMKAPEQTPLEKFEATMREFMILESGVDYDEVKVAFAEYEASKKQS